MLSHKTKPRLIISDLPEMECKPVNLESPDQHYLDNLPDRPLPFPKEK